MGLFRASRKKPVKRASLNLSEKDFSGILSETYGIDCSKDKYWNNSTLGHIYNELEDIKGYTTIYFNTFDLSQKDKEISFALPHNFIINELNFNINERIATLINERTGTTNVGNTELFAPLHKILNKGSNIGKIHKEINYLIRRILIRGH